MSELRFLAGMHPNDADTHMLPFGEVGALIGQSGFPVFVAELSKEIEAVYQDPGTEGLERTGWSEGAKTSEVMMCRDGENKVFKFISSNPENSERDLPTVLGTMVVYENGRSAPKLICDASLTTSIRTATTTSLVINKLKPDLETLSVIGAGFEGENHAAVAALSLPGLRRILLRDTKRSNAERTSKSVQSLIGSMVDGGRAEDIDIAVVAEDDPVVERESDAIVTATFGTEEVLTASRLQGGVIIAAVGADMEGKRELSPSIYSQAKFVTDELRQSLREGELQHAALRLGIGGAKEVITSHRGSLLNGRVIGITELLADPASFVDRDEPVTIYDSTGFAGQDLAVGKLMLRMLGSKTAD